MPDSYKLIAGIAILYLLITVLINIPARSYSKDYQMHVEHYAGSSYIVVTSPNGVGICKR